MTFWTRAAAMMALTFTMSGLLATSTPGAAAEIAGTAQVSPAPFEGYNTSPLIAVPEIPADETATAAAIEYASLDAAVAAQDHAADDEALRCLAGAIFYEAKGEPLPGQLAVAEVILNRARSGRFPADVCGVVLQRGQFGFVRGGAIPTINEAHGAWKRAVAVAKVAMADMWDSPASEALYFNASRRSPGARTVRIAAIGHHVFYR